jgi:hypothetical protein
MQRILILHPKSTEPDEVDALIPLVREHPDLPKLIPGGHTWDVTTARESFQAFEKKYGKPVNWGRWFSLITGVTATFGTDPTFHIFVIAPESYVGKATKDIVTAALQKGRIVLRLAPDTTLKKVTKVVAVDPENFKRGWIVA